MDDEYYFDKIPILTQQCIVKIEKSEYYLRF